MDRDTWIGVIYFMCKFDPVTSLNGDYSMRCYMAFPLMAAFATGLTGCQSTTGNSSSANTGFCDKIKHMFGGKQITPPPVSPMYTAPIAVAPGYAPASYMTPVPTSPTYSAPSSIGLSGGACPPGCVPTAAPVCPPGCMPATTP